MASTTNLGRQELANRLSEWSKYQMGCQISPESLLDLLHTPELMKIWTHVLTSVKSATPLESLYSKFDEIVKPAPPEIESRYIRLCEEDSVLDLEIANLQKNVELCSGIIAAKDVKVLKLQSEVFMHSSRVQVINAYCFLLEKNIQIIKNLISKVEIALEEVPHSSVHNNNSRLAVDILEALDLLHSYDLAVRGDHARKAKHKVHNKIRQMTKLYRCEESLEFLISKVESQKLQSDEQHSDIQMIKRIMGSCLADLQAAHRESFITVLALSNNIPSLQLQKVELMDRLKQHFATIQEGSQLEELCETNLRIIQKEEKITYLSKLEVPKGMPSLSHTDLQLVQKQIENQEAAIKNIRLQMTKVWLTNKTVLDSFHSGIQTSECTGIHDLEPKEKRVNLNLDDFYQNLDAVESLLAELRTWESDVSDLCVRPGPCVMNSRVQVELQSALDMPFYEAPEMLGMRLQRKTDSLWDIRSMSRMLTHLSDSLNLGDIKQHFSRTFKSVENSNSKATHIIAKANALSQHIKSLSTPEELKESLNDYKEQPAFNDSIL